jgi:hypothetical protein
VGNHHVVRSRSTLFRDLASAVEAPSTRMELSRGLGRKPDPSSCRSLTSNGKTVISRSVVILRRNSRIVRGDGSGSSADVPLSANSETINFFSIW